MCAGGGGGGECDVGERNCVGRGGVCWDLCCAPTAAGASLSHSPQQHH